MEKTSSSISGAGKTGQLRLKRMKLEHSLTPYTEANSKWIKDLTVKLDTTNIKLEESRLDPLTEITARPFGVYLLVRDR